MILDNDIDLIEKALKFYCSDIGLNFHKTFFGSIYRIRKRINELEVLNEKMYFIKVKDFKSKDVILEMTTDLETTKNAYVSYYKHYGYDVEVIEQLSLV